ncbi:MAG TPA: hypothetical protein VIJ30_06025 [Candidatus Dormibacteraeota bacterium]
MRFRSLLSVLLVLLVSSLVVLQPLSATAANDCQAERDAFNALKKEADAINDELKAALRDLDAAQRDMADYLQKLSDTAQKLDGQAQRVQQQMDQKQLNAALQALGTQVFLTIAIAAAGPEGYGALGHTIEGLFTAAEKAYTFKEMVTMLKEASEASSAMDKLTTELGNADELSTFASDNGLTELTYLINMEAQMAAYMSELHKAWSRWEDAADRAVAYQALLDIKGKQLQEAQEALYRCLGIPGPVPSACEGQATNPNGVGVCR